MVKVLYFAWVRDMIGRDEEIVVIPPDVTSVGSLAIYLAGLSDRHAQAFADPQRLRAAVDLTMVGFDATVVNAQEIAFFPPVTGG